MDDKSKLDAYLENLGISDETETSAPKPAPKPATAGPVAAQEAAVVARPARLVASPDAIAEDFLAGMLQNFGPSYTVVAKPKDENVLAEITGGDLGKLIGREGRTLAAIEFMTNTVLAKELGAEAPRVNVDAAGYRRRHEERLLDNARRIAERVRRNNQAFEMDPISAADRRIIHMALRDDEHVTTESVGEGRERRIVVKPRQ